jgi:hypothetical protein
MAQGQQIEALAKTFLQTWVPSQFPGAVIQQEPTFVDGPFHARLDVLVYHPGTDVYDIFEIKSSTRIAKAQHYDLTFQQIAAEANLNVRNIYIVHPDSKYVRQGEFLLDKFFLVENFNEKTAELREEVLQLRDAALRTAMQLTGDALEACLKPKDCPCPEECHPVLPDFSIYDIPRLHASKKRMLLEQGILAIQDIPADFPLTEKQQLHVDAIQSGRPLIDYDAIRGELAKLEYPLYFLDYETFNPCVPEHDGYTPFQHMVFQYSLHVFDAPGSEPIHYEHLALEGGDPSVNMLEKLAEVIGTHGSVIVWNKGFEASRNNEMADRYPEFAAMLENINSRIYDLMDIFSKGYYVHPEFHGSASIKKVLPVLVTDYDLSYEDLPIPAGDEAMMAWVTLMSGTLGNEEFEQIVYDLLHYCKLDTLAMVRNWEALENVVRTE